MVYKKYREVSAFHLTLNEKDADSNKYATEKALQKKKGAVTMKDSFSPVNFLLKGTSIAIEKAITLFVEYIETNYPNAFIDYELCEGTTFDPDRIDSSDKQIRVAKILYTEGQALDYGVIMDPKTIPFAKMPDIKYLLCGEGNDNNRFNGLFALFKDFGETENNICYQFSKFWHFHFGTSHIFLISIVKHIILKYLK